MEEFLLSWGLPVGCGASANCPLFNLYTITSIDAAVDLTTGIWVEAVATVRVGAVGGVVVGTGWARTLTLYPLLESTVLFLLSLAFESWGFPGPFDWNLGGRCKCLVVAGLVMAGFLIGAWVWYQAYPLIPNKFSSFR